MSRRLVVGNYNYSSWSLRAWLALRKTGVEFEVVRIPLFEAGYREQIQRFSPAGKVPVLHDGEVVVWDSLAICQYVSDQYGPLWPADREARALAYAVSAEMHAGFPVLRGAMPMNCRARDRHVAITPPLQAEIDRVCAVWTECRQWFGLAGDWLFGDFSVADALYAPVVLRFATYGVEVPDVCRAYMQHVLQDRDLYWWSEAAAAETETIADYEVGLSS